MGIGGRRHSKLLHYSPSVFIAWENVCKNKTRTSAALLGISVAIFIIFLQFGFLNAAKRASTLLYDHFDFDIAVVSEDYQFLVETPPVDRIRLNQARSITSVEEVFRLNVKSARWTDLDSGVTSTLLLIGIDDKPAFLADPALTRGHTLLPGRNNVLIDTYSVPDLGSLEVGTKAKIDKQQVTVAGQFNLGMFFYADGSAVVDNEIFARLTGQSTRQMRMGLLKITDGVELAAEKRRIESVLPDDVLVYTKDELLALEQRYFIDVKPMGILFQISLLVALAVGGTTLFQVVSTDISTQWKELATLRAIGFGSEFVLRIGFAQILVYSISSFVPAWLVASSTLAFVRHRTHLPAYTDASMVLDVLLISVLMCAAAGLAAVYQIRRMDPAQLMSSNLRG